MKRLSACCLELHSSKFQLTLLTLLQTSQSIIIFHMDYCNSLFIVFPNIYSCLSSTTYFLHNRVIFQIHKLETITSALKASQLLSIPFHSISFKIQYYIIFRIKYHSMPFKILPIPTFQLDLVYSLPHPLLYSHSGLLCTSCHRTFAYAISLAGLLLLAPSSELTSFHPLELCLSIVFSEKTSQSM